MDSIRTFIALFRESWANWSDNPIPVLTAVLIAALIAYLAARLRYHAKIDGLDGLNVALRERLALRDDAISAKDDAITALSGKPREPDIARSTEYFADTKARITRATELRILKLLYGNRFRLTFNPEAGGSKVITFRDDGLIGEGRNGNEYTWRLSDGRLEIVEQSGDVHSRFVLLPDGKSFHHTNEPPPITKSIRGQYIRLEHSDT